MQPFLKAVEKYSKQFLYVSYCRKSVPTEGSATQYTESFLYKVRCGASFPTIHHEIEHKNRDVTLATTRGYFRFSGAITTKIFENS